MGLFRKRRLQMRNASNAMDDELKSLTDNCTLADRRLQSKAVHRREDGRLKASVVWP